MNLAAERIESVKAGSLGATATTIAFVCFALVPVQPIAFPLLLIRGAIALVTGFLFGVTYRYIVRQDNNSHLRQGAVLAFGLVRGLAQVEGKLSDLGTQIVAFFAHCYHYKLSLFYL